jgi:hypothetical protein
MRHFDKMLDSNWLKLVQGIENHQVGLSGRVTGESTIGAVIFVNLPFKIV